MAKFLASSVQIIEEEPQVRGLPPLPTAILALVGLTERGDLDTPQTFTSWSDYNRACGGYTATAQVPLALRGYFLNGGRTAIVVRILGASGTATATVNLQNDDPADTLQLDASSVGVWGNDLSAEVVDASNGVAEAFDLNIYKSGVLVENWANQLMSTIVANMTDEDTGSLYIVPTNLGVGGGDAAERPENVAATPLTTGSDGAALVATDFADPATPDKGLETLEGEDFTLLATPDTTADAVQESLITFAKTVMKGFVFCLLDPPANSDVAGIRAHKAALTSDEFYALYWPRVKIPNPSVGVFGTGKLITVPPSGWIAGMMARNDAQFLAGPFEQPAGTERGRLFGVVDVERTEVLRESNRDLVFPELINPIVWERGVGVYVDGARTGKSDGNFPSVGERRGVSAVEKTLYIGLQFVRHRNNTEKLRGLVQRTVTGFLLGLTNDGAFASEDPAEAFFVDADVPGTGLNNAIARAQKKLYVRVGLATAEPAEFVIILVSKDTRALQEATTGRQ